MDALANVDGDALENETEDVDAVGRQKSGGPSMMGGRAAPASSSQTTGRAR